MRPIPLLIAAFGLATLACGDSPDLAHSVEQETIRGHSQHPEGQSGHELHEGAITFSSQGRMFNTTVLGGFVGTESVGDVKVGIYVLQAESPERLKPNGSGPTHLFNVTFIDRRTEELIQEATGSVTLIGGDGRQQREAFGRFESHFQARVRLDNPGDYLLRVDFETEQGSGVTGELPFSYRWKEGATADPEHQDEHH